VQKGDACARGADCCSNLCDIAQGATIGTCADPPSGATYCKDGIDGTLCAGCGSCCSRLCAPYGPIPEFYFSPIKIAEYLATGRPVIASAVGHLRHELGEGRGVEVGVGSVGRGPGSGIGLRFTLAYKAPLPRPAISGDYLSARKGIPSTVKTSICTVST